MISFGRFEAACVGAIAKIDNAVVAITSLAKTVLAF
jgi:hypothetical protein